MSTTRRSLAAGGPGTSHGRGSDDGLYVTVVVDHRLGSVESYGPLPAPRAVRVLHDLRALLATHGIDEVSVTACPLHAPWRPHHPDDP